MAKDNNDATRDAEQAYRATEFLYELSTVFRKTPVQSVTHGKFPFARSTLYNWRNGKSFYVTPYFLLLLDSIGYRLKLEKIETEAR